MRNYKCPGVYVLGVSVQEVHVQWGGGGLCPRTITFFICNFFFFFVIFISEHTQITLGLPMLLTGDSPGITLPSVGCWVIHHSTKPAPKLEADLELCFQKKMFICCCSLP